MKRRHLIRISSTVLLLWAIAGAQTAQSTVSAYLTLAEAPVATLLPPPPAPGSPEDLADLETVLWVQSRLSEAEFTDAKAHGDRPWDEFIRDVLGPHFNAVNRPETYRVLAGVRADFEAFLAAARQAYPRSRPPNRDERVRLLGTRTDIGSYPSAKVWSFYNLGLLLAELHPECRPRLEAEIRRQGWMRIWGGHHYPSDVSAGLIAGERLARAFLSSPRFQKELPVLRVEAARFRSLSVSSQP
ncbi:Major phosphate-irrepressible acid phosphatase precursor [Lacunisphaera limnophila]|uniref:Major phosphate-irrepressible acid phosphatase n=1 Tax=Lacunisphaera limnophila TaxID=1838286 RepID=A0A1D8ASG8_9BACT|nr:hypothetical protein [Lacunisphaera limnophila]AOS43819.1 Major phosphate-irrepressible acid phosphatase precursor [Lacunisphaera limnophila]